MKGRYCAKTPYMYFEIGNYKGTHVTMPTLFKKAYSIETINDNFLQIPVVSINYDRHY